MLLVLRFLPGESVTIDGVSFGIEFSQPSLPRPDRLPVILGAEAVSPLPEVDVCLGVRQRPGSLAIAFRAPREVSIRRIAAEDVL